MLMSWILISDFLSSIRTVKELMHACVLNCVSDVQLFGTLWTVAHKASLSMGFSGKNTQEGCHALLQGIFLTQGLNPCLLCVLHWQVGSLPLVPPGEP